MKSVLISTMAVLALCAFPGVSEAKERGCGYRLASLDGARVQLARALRTGKDVEFARAQLTRAKIKAGDEGCLVRTVVTKRVVKRRFVDDRRHFRSRWYDRDRFDDRRFDDRRYYDRRFDYDRRSFKRFDYDRFADRRRFDTLIRIKVVRPLSFRERRELDRLCDRWGWKY